MHGYWMVMLAIYMDNFNVYVWLLPTYGKVAGSASPGTLGASKWSPAMAK